MNIADIYYKFDQIGCLTFATIDEAIRKHALLICLPMTMKDYIFEP